MNEIYRHRYVESLESAAQRYREILEDLFGPCDPRFVFGTIRKSTDDTPRTNFRSKYHTEGGCIVDIHISDFPWEHCSPDQGKWQVAHECVHLLDPGIAGTATFLEEGLAAWFQNEPRFHDDVVKQYIKRSTMAPRYGEARDVVVRRMPKLITAVKDLRESGHRIREISAEVLGAQLPSSYRAAVVKLCSRFPA